MTQDLVQYLFQYIQGNLYWKVKVSDKINIGQKAGNKSGKYEIIRYNNKSYYTHRLVWLYFKGTEPKTIDHINREFRDNRIENLRAASYSENLRNTRKITFGSSFYKGVCWDKQKRKWMARIKLEDKRLFLGYFNNQAEAAKEYDKAALKYFGPFANINFKEFK